MSNSFVPPPVPTKNDKFVPPTLPQKNAVPDCTVVRQLQKPRKFKKRLVVLAVLGVLAVCIALYISTYIDNANKNVLIIEETQDGDLIVTGYEKIESGRLMIPKNVTEIGEEAFARRKNITSVTIPGNVDRIGQEAFRECTGLTKVTIKNGVRVISNRAFYDCCNLSQITIPGSVEYISLNAFGNCTNLAKVTIREGVEHISAHAFAGCSALTKVTIPGSVGYIGSDAFADCIDLTEVVIPEKFRNDLGSIFSGCNLATINFKFTTSKTPSVEEKEPVASVETSESSKNEREESPTDELAGSDDLGKEEPPEDEPAGSGDLWEEEPPKDEPTDFDNLWEEEETILYYAYTAEAPALDIIGHYADDWGYPISLTLFPEGGRIRDLRIVGLKMLDEPKDGVYFEADSVLFDVRTLEPGQGVVVEVSLADMPIRGIAFKDSSGNYIYALQKSGEDGSLVLSDQGIRQDSFLYEGQDQDSLKVFFAGCEPFNMETVASYGGAENLLFTTFGQISDFNIVSLNWYNIETGQKEDQCEIGWDWEESHYCTIGEQLLHVDSISQGQAVLVTENVKNPFDNTLPTWGVTYTDIFGVKHAKAYAGSGGNHEYSLIIVSEDIHPRDR